MAFLLFVVGFCAILIGMAWIMMDLFQSRHRYLAIAGDKCLIALLGAGLICLIAASVMLALRLP